MQEPQKSRLALLAISCFVMTILIIIIGGYIRISDAGESCPDWPTCFGEVHPFVDEDSQGAWWADNPDQIDSRGPDHRYTVPQIFSEWFHRLLVGIIAIPILYMAYLSHTKRDEFGEEIRALSFVAAILLFIQAVAGYITVRYDNVDWSVALHLSLAVGFAASLLWLWMLVERKSDNLFRSFDISVEQANSVFPWLKIITFSVLIVLILGAWVASTAGGDYNQACSVGGEGWPLCQGEVIPDVSQTAISVQMIHRIGVIIVAAVLLAGVKQVGDKLQEGGKAIKHSLRWSLALLLVNLGVGGLYILTATDGFVEWLSLLHLFFGVFTFFAAVYALLIAKVTIQTATSIGIQE
jgi:cytochrome c oxidase assembly protein subunit 15